MLTLGILGVLWGLARSFLVFFGILGLPPSKAKDLECHRGRDASAEVPVEDLQNSIKDDMAAARSSGALSKEAAV